MHPQDQAENTTVALRALSDNQDIETLRTPEKFLLWHKGLYKLVRRSADDAVLRHTGRFKLFHEEIQPLAFLLERKHTQWRDSRFRNLIEISNPKFKRPDVEVESTSLPFEWLEITCTTFDNDENFRMKHPIGSGCRSTTRDVLHDEHGRPISISNEPADCDVKNEVSKINSRIQKKCRKDYPESTALLVYFDDFRYGCDPELYTVADDACHSIKHIWSTHFECLFLIGNSGKRLIELGTQKL